MSSTEIVESGEAVAIADTCCRKSMNWARSRHILAMPRVGNAWWADITRFSWEGS